MRSCIGCCWRKVFSSRRRFGAAIASASKFGQPLATTTSNTAGFMILVLVVGAASWINLAAAEMRDWFPVYGEFPVVGAYSSKPRKLSELEREASCFDTTAYVFFVTITRSGSIWISSKRFTNIGERIEFWGRNYDFRASCVIHELKAMREQVEELGWYMSIPVPDDDLDYMWLWIVRNVAETELEISDDGWILNGTEIPAKPRDRQLLAWASVGSYEVRPHQYNNIKAVNASVDYGVLTMHLQDFYGNVFSEARTTDAGSNGSSIAILCEILQLMQNESVLVGIALHIRTCPLSRVSDYREWVIANHPKLKLEYSDTRLIINGHMLKGHSRFEPK